MEVTKVNNNNKNYCISCGKEIDYWNRHCKKCYLKVCRNSFIGDSYTKAEVQRKLNKKRKLKKRSMLSKEEINKARKPLLNIKL